MKSWQDKLLNSLSEYFHGGLNISFWRSCRISRVSFFHITPSSFTQSLRLLKPKPNIQTSKFLNLIFGELESTESRLLTWSSLQTDVMIDKMKSQMDRIAQVKVLLVRQKTFFRLKEFCKKNIICLLRQILDGPSGLDSSY